MGQYYIAILLHDNESKKAEIIKAYMEAFGYSGMKLTEHSYMENSFVNTFEYHLSIDGMFYKSRVVWAGDYADPEKDSELNLNAMTDKCQDKSMNSLNIKIQNSLEYRYIVNHTKKEFVDKSKHKLYHPLPLLTVEGNGRGGGDYIEDKGTEYIGIWARDVISVEKSIPNDYTELKCEF